MVATKGQAIALAVVSILTIGAGIAVIVLFKFAFEAIDSSGSTTYPLLNLFWPYGLPVLFTGGMGLVAAGVRNNIAVGLFMAAGIICLIIEGAFAVMAAIVLFLATCGISTSASCDVMGFSRAACALIIVSWLLMLAGTILSCVACCCGKRDSGQPGAIIVGSPGYELHNPGGGHHNPQYGQPGPYPQETKGQQRY